MHIQQDWTKKMIITKGTLEHITDGTSKKLIILGDPPQWLNLTLQSSN